RRSQQLDSSPTAAMRPRNEEAGHGPHGLLVHGTEHSGAGEQTIVLAWRHCAPADRLVLEVCKNAGRNIGRNDLLKCPAVLLAFVPFPFRALHAPPHTRQRAVLGQPSWLASTGETFGEMFFLVISGSAIVAEQMCVGALSAKASLSTG